MSIFTPGLVHTPVTPFTPDRRIDFDRYAQLIEFHLQYGAESLAVPMHAGESVSLTDEEQQALLEATIRQVAGRVPVIAHASDSGTAIACARAARAEAAGAAALVATTPNNRSTTTPMIVEHFAQIAAAVRIPFFVHYAPDEMGAPKFNTELVLKLIERIENLAGLIDSSQDWQFMISMILHAKRRRPEFQLLSGVEYMVPAGAVGATSLFSSLAGVAPLLVKRLYDLCRRETYFEARKPQEEVSALRQVFKNEGAAGLKAAMKAMGRDCGEPRRPLLALDTPACEKIAAALAALPFLKDEPRGW
ncbi:MAG: dihydrodipicolinate synthase family protein [Thermodesulfobacteriota bacterium]